VRLNGKQIKAYAGLDELKAANIEGWATGKDVYGDVTWVNVPAAKGQKITLSTL
jgi:hypothetical protein